MVEREIPVPKEIISWNGELPHLQSDRRKLDEAVRDTTERLAHAQRPLERAAKSPTFAIIEVMIDPRDLLPITVKYIRASAKKAQLKTRA